ncbi:MAG TPA: DUF6616 family protein [Roseiflexaceae bacterium]|nr:DUF6616 family protein [Roseiflexaceae bacterium]
MATPIYKVFLARPTEAWYALPKAQQDELLAKVNTALESVGGRRLAICDSSWASEQYQVFGLEEFPDIEAVQRFHAALNEFSWLRYVDTITTLGTQLG